MKTSLFASMNNAVRALQKAQYALATHGKNIANANDPSYTRRTILPGDRPDQTLRVARLRDAFIDNQYRLAAGGMGDAEAREQVMNRVEDIFGDPVEGGLRQAIDRFFDAWQGLAENPADEILRLEVLAAGRSFVEQVQSTYRKLEAVQQTINEQLATHVDEVNDLLAQVFDLNKRIAQQERNSLDSADLRDQRDRVLDRLAKLTGATSLEDPDGSVRVIVGSIPVVDGPTVVKLQLADTPDGPVPVWYNSASPDYKGEGTIGGLLKVRDNELKRLMADIDNLGKTIATEVNALHEQGTGVGGDTGLPFFIVSDGPVNFAVNPDLEPQQIAAGGGSGLAADGENARKIAALAEVEMLESRIIPGQFQSARTYYRNLVGWIGNTTRNARQEKTIAEAHLETTENQRQSMWGVSLDEEVAQMNLQQKAFAAAARVISAMDEMLEYLINRVG